MFTLYQNIEYECSSGPLADQSTFEKWWAVVLRVQHVWVQMRLC